jgi:serine/threonine protein kinase
LKVTLHSRLGDGGFADVWKATDDLGRDVAVKIVRASAAAMSSALAHARALARTSHPNIVSIISLERVTDPSRGRTGEIYPLVARDTTMTVFSSDLGLFSQVG